MSVTWVTADYSTEPDVCQKKEVLSNPSSAFVHNQCFTKKKFQYSKVEPVDSFVRKTGRGSHWFWNRTSSESKERQERMIVTELR